MDFDIDFGNYVIYSNLTSDDANELHEVSDEKAHINISVYIKATGAVVSQKGFNID